jgi:hypothetical protein
MCVLFPVTCLPIENPSARMLRPAVLRDAEPIIGLLIHARGRDVDIVAAGNVAQTNCFSGNLAFAVLGNCLRK